MNKKRNEDSGTTPVQGERFVLIRDVDRYPHFIAAEGSEGIVVDVSDDAVSLRLDDPLAGAEEWDNEVVWSHDWGQDFRRDVERVVAQ